MGIYIKKNEEYWNRYHRINSEGKKERICTSCNNWLVEEDNFYLKNKSKPEKGYGSQCKSCMSKLAFEREKKNPFKRKISSRKWNNKPETRKLMNELNKKRRESGKVLEWQRTESGKFSLKKAQEKRKAKKHRLSKQEWEDCKAYFNYECAYCGLPIEEHLIKRKGKLINIDLHKEHVIDQGRNDIKNTIPSCQSCNSSKHTSSLNDWYNKNNPNYTYERYHKIYQWLRYDYKKYIHKKKPKQKYTKKVS
jgi:hypothetical protein